MQCLIYHWSPAACHGVAGEKSWCYNPVPSRTGNWLWTGAEGWIGCHGLQWSFWTQIQSSRRTGYLLQEIPIWVAPSRSGILQGNLDPVYFPIKHSYLYNWGPCWIHPECNWCAVMVGTHFQFDLGTPSSLDNRYGWWWRTIMQTLRSNLS